MIVDGTAIANTIYSKLAVEVKELPRPPRMTAITCAPNFETKKYLELKKRKAASIGVALNIVELEETSTTKDCIRTIEAVAPNSDGIVVQLPLPSHIDREAVLAAVPKEKDPDAFTVSETILLSPVVAAIDEIATQFELDWKDRQVVILGQGRLVGKPATSYARGKGAAVVTLTEESKDISEVIKDADIIISGIGKPHFVTEGMVKDGVVIFDAGTSEDGGELRGDVHPDVAKKASLFTPVPGGIGPITVAALLRNLVTLAKAQ